jgi:hypothetical protein
VPVDEPEQPGAEGGERFGQVVAYTVELEVNAASKPERSWVRGRAEHETVRDYLAFDLGPPQATAASRSGVRAVSGNPGPQAAGLGRGSRGLRLVDLADGQFGLGQG